MPYRRPASLEAAIDQLIEGNLRYVAGAPQAPVASAERIELAGGQRPFAAVLGCSDSRVPVETIFDQAPGTLFVIRLAGHVVTGEVLASVEYAVNVLGCMLVFVLGHSGCGAVQAALAYEETGNRLPGHLQLLIDEIAPSIPPDLPGVDRWDAAVRANARDSARRLIEKSAILRAAAWGGAIHVRAGVYDLHSGRVEIIGGA